VFGGHNLDTVSAMLVGGSWDLDFAGALPGYKYGEFRLDRGATVGGGAYVRLSRALEAGGALDISTRPADQSMAPHSRRPRCGTV
jgi:hypothetical protein